MDGWSNEWMEGWKDGWLDEWRNGWRDGGYSMLAAVNTLFSLADCRLNQSQTNDVKLQTFSPSVFMVGGKNTLTQSTT